MTEAVRPEQESLRLYDTRTRSVRRFEPLAPSRVGIYSCGPNVYAPQHLGNMRSQLFPDLVRRVLVAAEYEVVFVTNITDVGHLVNDRDDTEDKMEVAAESSGRTAAEIAAFYREQWAIDRRASAASSRMSCPRRRRTSQSRSRWCGLLRRGVMRISSTTVSTSKSPRSRDTPTLPVWISTSSSTGRVDHVDAKRHPADFALWKLSPPGIRRQQEWDSPWGRGFPGWHIECSAMSTKYLGTTFDIHTGGIDHVRVHHTNEVAQSECALDVHPWVGTWMHNEFLDLAGEKVSKSKGHALVVDSLLERGLDPLAFRYFFLQAHYRQQQSFTWDAMAASATAHRRLVRHAIAARDAGGTPHAPSVEPHLKRFWSALADDLNSPRALAVVWDVVRAVDLRPAERWAFLSDADRALGLALGTAEDAQAAEGGSDHRIDILVADRHAARVSADFISADRIRDRLAAEGIELLDTPNGTTWRRP